MNHKEEQFDNMAYEILEDYASSYSMVDKRSLAEYISKKFDELSAGNCKQSEWISVDERLPTEEERRDEYGELIPLLVTEKDTVYPYRALYDGKTWGDGLTAITTITHWMPLPEPPKMKGGEADV